MIGVEAPSIIVPRRPLILPQPSHVPPRFRRKRSPYLDQTPPLEAAVNAVLIGTRGTSVGSAANVTSVGGTSTGGSGSVFLILVSFDPGVTNSTPTDSKSNSYSIIDAVVTGTGKLVTYQCANGTGGASHTASMNFSGAAFATLHLIEITGCATSSALDIHNSGTDAASPYTLASGVLGQAAEVLISFVEVNNGTGSGTYAESVGYTILSQEGNSASFWTSAVGKLVVASTASVTASWTRTGSGAGTTALLTRSFKEAAAGGSTFQTLVGAKFSLAGSRGLAG